MAYLLHIYSNQEAVFYAASSLNDIPHQGDIYKATACLSDLILQKTDGLQRDFGHITLVPLQDLSWLISATIHIYHTSVAEVRKVFSGNIHDIKETSQGMSLYFESQKEKLHKILS